MSFLRAGLLLAVCAAGATAADFQSWHSFDFASYLSGRTELVVHSQVRTHSRFTGLNQFRIGPVLNYAARPRLRLVAGYYYRDVESSGSDWQIYHRIFAGMENPIIDGRIGVQSRTYLEHCYGSASTPFNRLRQRMLVRWNRGVSPYAAVEGFFRSAGVQLVRYAAGVQRRLSGPVRLDITYYYEDDKTGADRHVITTGLRFDLGRPQ